MTTENKRDLAADLAICEAATDGPWFVYDDDERPIQSSKYAILFAGGSDNAFVGVSDEDEEFIAEAREGWPESIRRAMAAEEKWARLRAIVYTNATGGQGEDINEYDIISGVMDEIAEDVMAGE